MSVVTARYGGTIAAAWTGRVAAGQRSTRESARARWVALARAVRSAAAAVAVSARVAARVVGGIAGVGASWGWPVLARYGWGGAGITCVDVSAFQAGARYGWGTWVGMLVTGMSLIVVDAWVSRSRDPRMETPNGG